MHFCTILEESCNIFMLSYVLFINIAVLLLKFKIDGTAGRFSASYK